MYFFSIIRYFLLLLSINFFIAVLHFFTSLFLYFITILHCCCTSFLLHYACTWLWYFITVLHCYTLLLYFIVTVLHWCASLLMYFHLELHYWNTFLLYFIITLLYYCTYFLYFRFDRMSGRSQSRYTSMHLMCLWLERAVTLCNIVSEALKALLPECVQKHCTLTILLAMHYYRTCSVGISPSIDYVRFQIPLGIPLLYVCISSWDSWHLLLYRRP